MPLITSKGLDPCCSPTVGSSAAETGSKPSFNVYFFSDHQTGTADWIAHNGAVIFLSAGGLCENPMAVIQCVIAKLCAKTDVAYNVY